MKKLLILLAPFIAGPPQACTAQPILGFNYSEYILDALNHYPASGASNFYFNLNNGNRFSLTLPQLKYADSVQPPGPLLAKVYRDIVNINSFSTNSMTVKRINCMVTGDGAVQYHMTETPVKAETVLVKENDTAELKVQQDTVLIAIMNPAPASYFMGRNGLLLPVLPTYIRYAFVFSLNDWKQLKLYADGLADERLKAMQEGLRKQLRQKKRYRYTAYSGHDRPGQGYVFIPYGQGFRSPVFEVVANAGLQNYRQQMAPSAQAGVMYQRAFVLGTNKFLSRYSLLWEPVFFFGKNDKNETLTRRNDFITFRYENLRSTVSDRSNNFSFFSGFSAGFLVNQQGGFMPENTIKFSINGLRHKTLLVEPQFYFHNLFRQFTPSLRVSVAFE